MKFGWREAAESAADVDESDFEPEVDQEFEDACVALAMSDGPKLTESDPSESDPAVIDPPVVRPTPVATAAELAEDAEADTDDSVGRADTTVGLDPRSGLRFSPQMRPEASPEVSTAVSPEMSTAVDPDVSSALIAAETELAETRAELESLRADFQAERFRARDERVRLEDELSAARRSSTSGSDHPLGDSGELQALQREVDALRGELVDSRSRHTEELAQLGTDLKAAQAREAQTVIAAQLAEDELTAVRADHDVTREALRTTQSQGDAGQVDLEAANAAFDNSLKTSARELAALRAERDALRQVLNEVDAKEAALAADWDAERLALQQEIRTVRETAADAVRKLEDRLEAKEAELAVTQQELLDAEMRRAEEAASFLQALQE